MPGGISCTSSRCRTNRVRCGRAERVVGRAPLRAGDRLRIGSPGVAIELIAVG